MSVWRFLKDMTLPFLVCLIDTVKLGYGQNIEYNHNSFLIFFFVCFLASKCYESAM